MSRALAVITSCLLLTWGASAPGAPARTPAATGAWGRTVFGRPLERGGFHFQVSLGMGGGPDSVGVFHDMELGYTRADGITLGLIHAFIQNKGVITDLGGPDLLGGWMFLLKVPVLFDDLVYKVAAGPGGIHDQTDGIHAIWGVSWLYGFDLHLPLLRTSGLTATLVALHAVAQREHHVGLCLGLGYTWF